MGRESMTEQDALAEGESGALEQEARDLGWRPKNEWKGDPDSWIDADQFVERGRHIMPILKENNRRLNDDLSATRKQLQELQAMVAAGQDSMNALKEFNEQETRRQVEKARKDLLAELKAAKKAGDVDSEVEIQEEINKLDKPPEVVPKKEAKQPPPLDPEFVAWSNEVGWNTWPARRKALALGIAEELKETGLKGRAFLDKVLEEVNATLSPRDRSGNGKAEGSAGGARAGSQGSGRGWADLPSDAKAACDSFEGRLVGKGRAFETKEAWRKEYARKYWEGEQA